LSSLTDLDTHQVNDHDELEEHIYISELVLKDMNRDIVNELEQIFHVYKSIPSNKKIEKRFNESIWIFCCLFL
jgi:hypothetical protein